MADGQVVRRESNARQVERTAGSYGDGLRMADRGTTLVWFDTDNRSDVAASAGVHSIDPSTGAATLFTRLTVALAAPSFGADLNRRRMG